MAHQPSRVNTPLKKKKKEDEAKLNITSMMDLMTIILLFLLKSYDAEGNLPTQADGLVLPKSITETEAKTALTLVVSQKFILVEGDVVASTEQVLARIKTDPGSYRIESLYSDLSERSDNEKQLEAQYGTKFKGEIAVQIDENIPFEVLTRIMYTCGQSGYVGMRLLAFMKG